MQAQKPINMISSVVLHPVQPCYVQLHQKSYARSQRLYALHNTPMMTDKHLGLATTWTCYFT